MSHKCALALVVSIMCLADPSRADYLTGADAYKHGDFKAALGQWRPLAEQGHAVAQYRLGSMYDHGMGLPQDYTIARGWYEKAAAQGNMLAQIMLGAMYYDGRGVPKDLQHALRWFRLAANQGDALAQLKLGLMLSGEPGVSKDLIQAHMWANLSAANGEASGAKLRDAIAEQMTSAQIAEAQTLARAWNAKPK